MGEIADELRELEICHGYNFFKEMTPEVKISPNWMWTDRNGKTQSFMEMDGFHLWNIKVFILRSKNRGLKNRLHYIDLALAAKNYGVEEYRRDCERLNKENKSANS